MKWKEGCLVYGVTALAGSLAVTMVSLNKTKNRLAALEQAQPESPTNDVWLRVEQLSEAVADAQVDVQRLRELAKAQGDWMTAMSNKVRATDKALDLQQGYAEELHRYLSLVANRVKELK